MSQAIEPLDLSELPEEAQAALLDFYLFLKQRYRDNCYSVPKKKGAKMERLHALQVEAFTPLIREEIHER